MQIGLVLEEVEMSPRHPFGVVRRAIGSTAAAAVQSGESPTQVAAALGVNLRSLFRWLALYRRGGWDQFDARKRGGRPPKLDGRALRWIYRTLSTKNPQQLKFPFALWTAAMVQTLIAERYKVKLSHSSVCRLLHQLGLSAQRPLWRAYQQNPEAVKHWLATDYPTIRRRARREGAQIFFADEAGVRSDFHSGTTWGPRSCDHGRNGLFNFGLVVCKRWYRDHKTGKPDNRAKYSEHRSLVLFSAEWQVRLTK